MIRPACLLLLALLPPLQAQADPRAAPDPIRLPFPLAVDEVISSPPALGLRNDPAALAALDGLEQVRLEDVPLPDGRTVALDLEAVDLERMAFGLHLDGLARPDVIPSLGLTLWRGRVVDEDGSDVFLGFSSRGTHGWIRTRDAEHHVMPLDQPMAPGAVRSLIVEERSLMVPMFEKPPVCAGTPPVAPGAGSGGAGPPQGGSGAPATGGSLTTGPIAARIAIEADYQLRQKFASDSDEVAYLVTLLGAVSTLYEEQLDVVLVYPFLNVWTIPSDPWDAPDDPGSDTGDALDELKATYSGQLPKDSHLVHLLSGAPLGGGLAWVDVLCNESYGFGVSAIGGATPFPVVQGPLTWDFVVIAHELGHNFGAPHTHDTNPPIDECAPEGWFGKHQDEQDCITDGTIMSYCHQCPGGMSNIELEFHPKIKDIIEDAIPSSCLVPLCTQSTVWYDYDLWSSSQVAHAGTQADPCVRIEEAVALVCPGSTLMMVAGTHFDAPATILVPMTIDAHGGHAILK